MRRGDNLSPRLILGNHVMYMTNEIERVNRTIDNYLPDMLRDIGEIIAVPAMAPSFESGEGELARSQVVEGILERSEVFDSITRYDATHNTETGDVTRPNLVAMVNGSNPALPTTWIVTHMDEVPPGDSAKWYSNPRKLTLAVEDGGFQTISFDNLSDYVGHPKFEKLVAIGRSIDDDVKPGVGAVYALKALKENVISPKRNIGVVFVSDEETGRSEYGIRHLAENIKLFKPEDLIIVPDFGNGNGDVIEVAEKSRLVIKITTEGEHFGNGNGDVIEVAEKSRLVVKITTEGEQGHSANGYDMSNNAAEVASRYQLDFIDWFRKTYDAKNELFDPPYSTIQPTERHIEAGSTNTVPGTDRSFIDMRLLPNYDVDEVLRKARSLADEFQERFGVQIEVAEKSRLVVKISTEGEQGHSANGYDMSNNAAEVASRYQLDFIDWFRETYDAKNELFDPPYSTIQPTMRHIEAGSTNTVPGTDRTFIDMRLLPNYDVDKVLRKARSLADEYQERFGVQIEVAEKSRLVVKITTEGEQGHSANGYDMSNNAAEVASRYQLDFIDWFRETYDAKNELFDPPYSTIQPTERHIETGSTNTVPGTDRSFIDMRLLPNYDVDEVLRKARSLADEFQERFGVQIKIDSDVYRPAPPETSPESDVVLKLVDAIREVRGVEPKVIGIGGGTCASHLRKVAVDGQHLGAAVYCSTTDTEHQVNERAKLTHILYDTKVFAHVFMN